MIDALSHTWNTDKLLTVTRDDQGFMYGPSYLTYRRVTDGDPSIVEFPVWWARCEFCHRPVLASWTEMARYLPHMGCWDDNDNSTWGKSRQIRAVDAALQETLTSAFLLGGFPAVAAALGS